jgi:endonuclease YncB( thermonuclease family)
MRPIPNHIHMGVVLDWYDGDTLKIDGDLDYEVSSKGWHRLVGVDTPELPTPGGYSALDYVRSIAPVGSPIVYVSYKNLGGIAKVAPKGSVKEKYGRWLCELWPMNQPAEAPSLNVLLIQQGHARPYNGGKR